MCLLNKWTLFCIEPSFLPDCNSLKFWLKAETWGVNDNNIYNSNNINIMIIIIIIKIIFIAIITKTTTTIIIYLPFWNPYTIMFCRHTHITSNKICAYIVWNIVTIQLYAAGWRPVTLMITSCEMWSTKLHFCFLPWLKNILSQGGYQRVPM